VEIFKSFVRSNKGKCAKQRQIYSNGNLGKESSIKEVFRVESCFVRYSIKKLRVEGFAKITIKTSFMNDPQSVKVSVELKT
jgi:hypothetical protein